MEKVEYFHQTRLPLAAPPQLSWLYLRRLLPPDETVCSILGEISYSLLDPNLSRIPGLHMHCPALSSVLLGTEPRTQIDHDSFTVYAYLIAHCPPC